MEGSGAPAEPCNSTNKTISRHPHVQLSTHSRIFWMAPLLRDVQKRLAYSVAFSMRGLSW